MENTNNDWLSRSDIAIISIIGEYIKQERLKQNKTQAFIAKAAGINRWTISKIENGEPISLLSLIQILRALKKLDILQVFKTTNQISPIMLAKLEKQKRQRATKASKKEDRNTKTKSEW